MAFLEERLDESIRLGMAYSDSFFTEIVETSNGSEYARLTNQYMRRRFDIGYVLQNKELAARVASLYYRVWGQFAGFRVKAFDDYSTALDGQSAYTALDCTLPLVSAGVYQLVKEYARDKTALAGIGRPKRTIYKPVSGKVAFGVAGVAYPSAQWSVDTTTGRITCAANKTRSITGISQAASAVVTIGSHTFAIGESVVFSGVVGMTQINNLRALITNTSGTTITAAINSTAFTAWASGGTVQTQPVAGEAITGGCEFDIPCRFDSEFNVQALESGYRDASLQLVEKLNP